MFDPGGRAVGRRAGRVQLNLLAFKAQVALLEDRNQNLKMQRIYLTGLITDEQSRWTTFNALLDELGKTVEVENDPLAVRKTGRTGPGRTRTRGLEVE